MEPGRGPFLKNTKRSSPEDHFGRFGNVKLPRALRERAIGLGGSPADGSGGRGRAWAAGARETEPSSARRGRAGPVVPDGDVKPPGGPAEQRVLESAL